MENTIKESNNLFISKFLKKLGYHFCVSLLAIVFIPLFPVLLVTLYFPMWIIRQIIALLAKIRHPDLSEMATCATTICENANGSKNNPRMVHIVELLFEKQLDFSQLVTEFSSRAVNKIQGKEEKLQYPNLQRHLTSWLGFWFWKNDQNFDVKNHITCSNLNKDFVTSEDLRQLEQQLLCKPFAEGKSPWEILMIPNTLLPKKESILSSCDSNFLTHPSDLTTTVIFRCSHTLADGYSVKKLLEAVSTVKVSPLLKINYPSKTALQKLFFPLKFYYTMAECQVLALSDFSFKMRESDKSSIDSLQSSDVIPLQLIRQIKDAHGVSFTSVIICIVAGALRKLWLKKNGQLCDSVPCAIPLPKPGHPDTLTNHL